MKYYFHELSSDEKAVTSLAKYLENDLAKGAADKRTFLKGTLIDWELKYIKDYSHLTRTTDVIKAIVLNINDDILVRPKPRRINQLKGLASTFL